MVAYSAGPKKCFFFLLFLSPVVFSGLFYLVALFVCFLGDFFPPTRTRLYTARCWSVSARRVFPSFLGDESGSLAYVEHWVRFELAEDRGFEESRRRARWCYCNDTLPLRTRRSGPLLLRCRQSAHCSSSAGPHVKPRSHHDLGLSVASRRAVSKDGGRVMLSPRQGERISSRRVAGG